MPRGFEEDPVASEEAACLRRDVRRCDPEDPARPEGSATREQGCDGIPEMLEHEPEGDRVECGLVEGAVFEASLGDPYASRAGDGNGVGARVDPVHLPA